MEDNAARIAREARSWEGVLHDGVELRLGPLLLARIEGDRLELCYTRRVAAMLVETGRAAPAGPGRVRVPLTELDDALELLRLAYERARVRLRVHELRERVGTDVASRENNADPPAADDA